MGFLKQLTRSLFGSFLSSGKKRRKKKKVKKKSRKKKKVRKKGKAVSKKVKKKAGPKRKTTRKKKVVRKKAKATKKKKVLKPSKSKKKKGVKKSKVKKSRPSKLKKEQKLLIGEVTHYFPNVDVGVIEMQKDQLILGEEIEFKGATTSFKQKVKSMQIDRVDIDMAVPGNEIGLKVKKRVRAGDRVYKAS